MEFIESFMKFSFSDDDIFRIEEDELVKPYHPWPPARLAVGTHGCPT